MPVTASARKALRRDRHRASVNQPIRARFHEAIRQALAEPSEEAIAVAYGAIDQAKKKRVIHANRADRLKSRLMRSIKRKASA